MSLQRPCSAAAVLAIATGLVWLGSAAPATAGDVAPGAYCPLPPKGQKPRCLEPAEAKYGEFFAGLAGGNPSDEALSRVERDVAVGAASENPFLALSSLAYGYYAMAAAAAEDPDVDPELIARLERWNELLADAYEASPEAPAYRRAVREAALDLRERAAPVGLRCFDAAGAESTCDSTEAVLRGLAQEREHTGVRGALSGLIERAFGADSDAEATP